MEFRTEPLLLTPNVFVLPTKSYDPSAVRPDGGPNCQHPWQCGKDANYTPPFQGCMVAILIIGCRTGVRMRIKTEAKSFQVCGGHVLSGNTPHEVDVPLGHIWFVGYFEPGTTSYKPVLTNVNVKAAPASSKPAPTKLQTAEEKDAEIARLQKQVASLQGDKPKTSTSSTKSEEQVDKPEPKTKPAEKPKSDDDDDDIFSDD